MINDGRTRNRAIDHLLIRTLMSELDVSLAVLRDTAQSLRHSGLLSANRIIDAMRPGGVADVLPHGTIGRPINGYRVTGMKNPEKDAKLSTQHMVSDPHTYVSELGGLVSLLTAACGAARLRALCHGVLPPGGQGTRPCTRDVVDDRRSGRVHPGRVLGRHLRL